MSDLRPCPFCGGEAEATFLEAARYYKIQCGNTKCIIRTALPRVYNTEAEAIEAWNTRHERTCDMIIRPDYRQRWADSTAYDCTSCGHVNLDPVAGGYCRWCGARVKEEADA